MMLKKPKVHLLQHAVQDVRHFGLLIHQATERQEKYNAVFRACTIYGNGQANSRDVANWFAHADVVTHLVTGGLFQYEGTMVTAGAGVLGLLKQHQDLALHFGCYVPKEQRQGKDLLSSGVMYGTVTTRPQQGPALETR